MNIYSLINYFAVTSANCDVDKNQRLLGIIPKWYKYLPYEPKGAPSRCAINIDFAQDGFRALLPAGLAVMEIMLAIAGLVAVGFVIYGGFQYVLSQGDTGGGNNPGKVANAKNTILNALIGTVVVLIASASVSFIGNRLGTLPTGNTTGSSGVNLNSLPNTGTGDNADPVKIIFNIFLGVAGATAVLIITIQALRFTLSRGDPNTISKAKNGIIYALIGLVIIIFAATLVNFVFGQL